MVRVNRQQQLINADRFGKFLLLNEFASLEEAFIHTSSEPGIRWIQGSRKAELGDRPSYKPKVFYHSFSYQAKSWRHSRRVVAKIEWHAGELFPRIGFIVTNLNKHSKNVVKFYNGRGTAEQWIKEGKNPVK